jgi:hypothetical protein
MLPVLFSTYIKAVMEQMQSHLKTNFKLGKQAIDTVMLADDQVIFVCIENELQLVTRILHNITKT